MNGYPKGHAPARVIAIVGPTATGKSDLALEIARHLGGPSAAEIIGADAMALYRGMDIGTAKVPEGSRHGIAHHMVDVLDVTEAASVAAYQRQATKIVRRIFSEGKTPIVVGGSGMYVRALLDQLRFPPTNSALRANLTKELEDQGGETLHRRLSELDPAAAETIAPSNGRRLVRALEVIELTGKPYSATLPRYTYHWPSVQIGLNLDRDQLESRIHARARTMFASGLIEEVNGLTNLGLRASPTAQYATGYRQALAALDGEMTVEEAVEDTALRTLRLARKQIKWFKRDPRIQWLDAADPELLSLALRAVANETRV